MFYKMVMTVRGWVNTGRVAYGVKPVDTDGVKWVAWYTV